jgi:DNA-binding response OmpR family regulator
MATEDNKDRILVVDDEAAVRELTIRAMNQEGFTCDPAINGEQALKMLEITPYVAVITDLRMPQIHGHALAVDLLHRDDRPVVFVLTGIVEPKLTKDFLSRGVDDVFFKPVDHWLMAVKLSALLSLRKEEAANADAPQRSDSRSARPTSSTRVG